MTTSWPRETRPEQGFLFTLAIAECEKNTHIGHEPACQHSSCAGLAALSGLGLFSPERRQAHATLTHGARSATIAEHSRRNNVSCKSHSR
ncbi:hypothetical protein MPLB_790107 [Mesorhizobium sp. ORS 3324]|nr:hypothetical protein MPLB_790107 [Mesorhizobium sp. ORS 3324]